jgi:hypothetical protein
LPRLGGIAGAGVRVRRTRRVDCIYRFDADRRSGPGARRWIRLEPVHSRGSAVAGDVDDDHAAGRHDDGLVVE